MSFASVQFIVFLAILFLVYYLLPKKTQWVVLLAASYVFYYFAGLKYFVFIIFTTITTYLATILMDRNLVKQKAYLKENKGTLSREEKKAYKASVKKKNRLWLVLCLVLNFVILFFCKALLLDSVSSLVSSSSSVYFLTLGLPMGMSFYMFQSMGYVIDVYREKAQALKNPFKTALFTAFFPQLIQGPISKFDQLEDGLFSEHEFNKKEMSFGIQRMLWGFFKKLLIADRIAAACSALKGDEYTGVAFFVLTLFYSVQLYCDFSGGIDIAIGIGQCLGVKMPENFDRPFMSKNIAEYWRRWHITLSDWMKSYIFYPINVSGPMLKLSSKLRKKIGKFGVRIPVYIATIISWLCTGIWHGFNPHYIVWGLANCFVIIISEELNPVYEKFHNKTHLKGKKLYTLFEIARTFILMNFIRALDLFDRLGDYFSRFISMFTHPNFSFLTDGSLLELGITVRDYVIIAAGIVIITCVSLMQRKGSVRERFQKVPAAGRYAVYIAAVFVILIIGVYGIGYDASSFIYNQF